MCIHLDNGYKSNKESQYASELFLFPVTLKLKLHRLVQLELSRTRAELSLKVITVNT